MTLFRPFHTERTVDALEQLVALEKQKQLAEKERQMKEDLTKEGFQNYKRNELIAAAIGVPCFFLFGGSIVLAMIYTEVTWIHVLVFSISLLIGSICLSMKLQRPLIYKEGREP